MFGVTMATFNLEDCVLVRPGPGGNYPPNPNAVGKKGTVQALVPFEETPGVMALEPSVYIVVKFEDGSRDSFLSEFLEPC